MTKHDILAHVWQFVNYVEERIACPKLYDKGAMTVKLEQVKEALRSTDADTNESDVRAQPQSRGAAGRTDKGMAGKTKRRA